MMTDCQKTVDKIIKKIPGKTNATGLAFLCEIANALTVDGLFIDLGTYYGRSAMTMLMGSFGNRLGRRVVSIDNFSEGVDAKKPDAGPPPTYWRVASQFKCKNRAVLIYGDTHEVPMLCRDEPIALVFVDADHTRAGLTADIETWMPLVGVGGVMAFDDYGSERWPDVQAVVDEYMADWEPLGVRGSVAAFRRKD